MMKSNQNSSDWSSSLFSIQLFHSLSPPPSSTPPFTQAGLHSNIFLKAFLKLSSRKA